MSLALDILAWAALLSGGFFTIIAAIGMLRMPDMYTRAHASSVYDTVGIGLLILGMLLQAEDWAVAIRLLIILVVLYFSGAVAAHALSRAALHDGQHPLLAGSDGQLRPTECTMLDPELGARLSRALISETVEDEPAPAEAGDDRHRNGEGPPWSS